MALDYQLESRLKDLAPVLDDLGAWYSRIMRVLAYPEAPQTSEQLTIPRSFSLWAQSSVAEDDDVVSGLIGDMVALHADVEARAYSLLNTLVGGVQPDITSFDHFVAAYEGFVSHMHSLERDLALHDTGFDRLTGLRTKHVMTRDLGLELDRLSRQGKPFCLALARIDRHDVIKTSLAQTDYDVLMHDAAEIIKKCIRSFDDAYYLGDGEFLMTLKQTEIGGGSAGLNRLRKLLEQNAPVFRIDGKDHRLSMSSCIAEPQPEDKVDQLLVNMRTDLNRYSGDGQAVVEYVEMSPIQRFITDGKV